MAKKKFYAVPKGRKPGIYRTWPETQAQVHGFPKAKFKGFKTMEEANEFFEQHSTAHSVHHRRSVPLRQSVLHRHSAHQQPNRFFQTLVL